MRRVRALGGSDATERVPPVVDALGGSRSVATQSGASADATGYSDATERVPPDLDATERVPP